MSSVHNFSRVSAYFPCESERHLRARGTHVRRARTEWTVPPFTYHVNVVFVWFFPFQVFRNWKSQQQAQRREKGTDTAQNVALNKLVHFGQSSTCSVRCRDFDYLEKERARKNGQKTASFIISRNSIYACVPTDPEQMCTPKCKANRRVAFRESNTPPPGW